MPNAQTKETREVNDIIGDHGGYFDLVVKPVLQKGHEGELCSWLKEVSLIRSCVSCSHLECNGKNLIWSPARIVDKYNWTCTGCGNKKSIREDSFFLGIKCDLKLCLQIILAWCQSIPMQTVAEYLGLKEHIIKKVYERCRHITEMYTDKHTEEWCLGGPGKVVIIDEFPHGLMSQNILDVTTTKKRNNNFNNIICVLEVNTYPQRMWFHLLKSHPEAVKANKGERIQGKEEFVEETLNVIMQHVAPESFIVANDKVNCCNYKTLLKLKMYNVISVENLERHDSSNKSNILSSLQTILQLSREICEDAQDAAPAMARQLISSHMWRQRFASSPSMAFQYILNHISEFYKFT